jgi:hypothetical protein
MILHAKYTGWRDNDFNIYACVRARLHQQMLHRADPVDAAAVPGGALGWHLVYRQSIAVSRGR